MTGLARRVQRRAGLSWGHLTSSLRRTPDFIIIGAQKCGTTSLYYQLLRHPNVRPARFKEIHFFDRHYHRGLRWYRAHFPRGRPALPWRESPPFVCGEATPDYFTTPEAPCRIREALPSVRLLLLLRDPVARAYSHYQHNVRRGREQESFDAAVERELRNMSSPAGNHANVSRSYLLPGLYGEHLARWLRVFPNDRVLVLKSEEYFESDQVTCREVLPFLGLCEFPMGLAPGCNWASYPAMSEPVRASLTAFFRGPNAELEQLCQRSFGW